MSHDIVRKAAKVKRAKNREKVFLNIDGRRISSEIAQAAFGSKSATMLSITSRALKELTQERLAEPINPDEKTGRVYRLTPAGMKVRDSILKYG